jgi:hypothetical protein
LREGGGGGRGGGGVCSQCVPQVLKCVLKDAPNNTSFFFSLVLFGYGSWAVEGKGGGGGRALQSMLPFW